MNNKIFFLIFLSSFSLLSFSQNKNSVYEFGEGGQLKMIYDRRQRPQALYINNTVFLVYNGGATKGSKKTYPFVLEYNPKSKHFSTPIKLSEKGGSDQHYCPIIWADEKDFLHLLYGCHKTPGTHLISKNVASIGSTVNDWQESSQISNSLSYPTVHRIFDNKRLIYFRTGEHRSSWSYLISGDDGKTWNGPQNPVTDLNHGDEINSSKKPQEIDEASSYHTCLPSKDGKFLHVAFCYYDDNKKNIPEKFYNPRYKTSKNLNFKFNIYYLKINLENGNVQNFDGEILQTPIDLETANLKCKIWDTDWRGTGIPPEIVLDQNNEPAFLHVLSGETPDEFYYYYLHRVNEKWETTTITSTDHHWNCGYIFSKNDKLHAYLVKGKTDFVDHHENKKGMNSYGGGCIEEWISADKGKNWKKLKLISPTDTKYKGWKFNNIQPVKDKNGNVIDGLFVFYGWKNSDALTAKAFLVDTKN